MCGDYPQAGSLLSRASVSTVNKVRLAFGIILTLAGIVWILQGLDVSFAPQSGMTGDVTWVLLGAVAVLIGLWLIWSGRRTNSDQGSTSDPD